jgi:hypothetical protein
MTDRMPVILGDKYSVNAWLHNSSLKIEEITVPYEGADLVSPCYTSFYQYTQIYIVYTIFTLNRIVWDSSVLTLLTPDRRK